MRQSPRYIIRSQNDHHCTVLFEGILREYWAPSHGGYIREITPGKPGTLGKQVIKPGGHTLYWTEGYGTVADHMRRYVKAQIRSEELEYARYL